jgi:hypothetical protein
MEALATTLFGLLLFGLSIALMGRAIKWVWDYMNDNHKSMNEEKKFTCARCGNTFVQGWTDEEAKEEYKEAFAVLPESTAVDVVCDDCYNQIMSEWGSMKNMN